MSSIKNFAAVWIGLMALTLYVILYYTVGYFQSKFVADWFVLLTTSFMSAATAPVAYRIIKRGITRGSDQFMLSYFLIVSFLLIQRIWLIILAQMGRPPEWAESIIPGFIATMIAIGAGYGMSSSLNEPAELPRREIIIMSVAAGISGVVAGMAIGVFILSGFVLPS